MGCGMQNLCRRRNSEEDEETSSLGYSVAVSNSMFREERWVESVLGGILNMVIFLREGVVARAFTIVWNMFSADCWAMPSWCCSSTLVRLVRSEVGERRIRWVKALVESSLGTTSQKLLSGYQAPGQLGAEL